MDKVKIGFVGVGNMGQAAHLKNYTVLKDCEVVAISEVRDQLGKSVAKKYGIPNVYKSHKEMLNNEKLDGIVASQQFTYHGTLITELLKSGIPVLSEKPLASTIAGGEKIVKAVSDTKNWLMVGYHKRSDPASMYVKKEITRLQETQELGKLTYIRIIMPSGDYIAGGYSDLLTSDEPYPQIEIDPCPPDMNEKEFNDYLGFVNYYIHQVNFMRYLLGEDYTVKYADPSSILLITESDSGVPGVIEMTPYQTSIDWQESIFVAFEYGWIKLNLPPPLVAFRPGTVEIFIDKGNGAVPETRIPQMPNTHAMQQQASNFISAIRGEMKPMCNASEALKDLYTAYDYRKLRILNNE